MSSDRERWDAVHAAGARDSTELDPFVASALDALANLGPGRALDLASGTGRHALELARRGWRTSAFDVSPVALERLAARAAAERLAVETRALDLVREPLPPETAGAFDLVVVVNFLDRGLLGQLHELVPIGGHLVVATYTEDHPGERPAAEHRLRRGELARGLAGFAPLWALEEGGRAGLVAARRRLASDGRSASHPPVVGPHSSSRAKQ